MENPKLQAPGKGLPLVESLVARFYYGPIVSKKFTAEQNWKRFEKTNQKILDLTKNISDEKIHQKVLVPRLPAIEDSSRYWSVAETLEHIEIVGDSIASGIEMLLRNEVPTKKVNIAEYKPKGKYNDLDPRPPFLQFSKRTTERLKHQNITLAKPYYHHPWMGNFSALQWLWLLAGHSGIHLNQIMHIKSKL